MTSIFAERDTNKVDAPTSNDAVYAQGPTPPQSPRSFEVDIPTPRATESPTLVSVSTSFYPQFCYNGHPTSLVLLSSDSVHFYIHSHVLESASQNDFDGLLNNQFHELLSPGKLNALTPSPVPILPVPLHSTTLNVLLHAIYNIPCAQFAPSTNTLIEAVDLFPTYGMSPTSFIYSDRPQNTSSSPPIPSPLYSLLLSHALLHPLPIYTLAAHHNIEDLAVASSRYLLATPLYAISEHAAVRMGATYLKRLAFLFFGRSEALKRLIAQPPPFHAPTRMCGSIEQERLAKAWTLAVASLVWDARPDLPTPLIEASLRPLGSHLECHLCQYNLRERIRDVTIQWLDVKVSMLIKPLGTPTDSPT